MHPNIPIISIIIPTRNRVRYALSAINSILAIESGLLQLVIQDNSDSDELEKHIILMNHDKRLVYNRSVNPLSFVDNFSEAVAHATGEYLCIIGDDDGVNPEIIEAAIWAKNNNIDAIKPSLCAQYLWPGVNISSAFTKKFGSTLTIGEFKSKISIVNVKQELEHLLKDGCQNYFDRNLPKIYHGIVKNEYMQNVKTITGKYFGGLTPDIYSVVALSTQIEKLAVIDYPLTIPGAAIGSGSIDSATGKHTGKLEDAPHFKGHENYVWAQEVPKFYSVETIWADSAIAALRETGNSKLLEYLRVDILCAYCYFKYKEYFKYIFDAYYDYNCVEGLNRVYANAKFVVSLITGPGKNFLYKSIKRLVRYFHHDTKSSFQNVESIEAATLKLKTYLIEQGYSFHEVSER